MKYSLFFAVFMLSFLLSAQDARLATQYYTDGEFEKALVMFQQLYQKNPGNEYYFKFYLNCLQSLNKNDEAEELLKKEIQNRPKDCQLHILYANLLNKRNQTDKAEKQFKLAIEKLPPDVIVVHNVANSLIELSRFDQAIEVYEKGERTLKGIAHFNYQLADLYRRKGDVDKMLSYYLEALEDRSLNQLSLQNLLQAYLPKEKMTDLQSALFTRIEKKPDDVGLAELLQWSYIQNKDFTGALRQAKALDKRMNENGSRPMYIGNICTNEREYKTAIEAFNYVKTLGPSGPYYMEALRQTLFCRRKIIVENKNYSVQDLIDLEKDYDQFKNEFSQNRYAADILIEYAELEARYLNNIGKAIDILKAVIQNPVVDQRTKARAKLDLGDYYLISGERWESTLLYSQVDKDFLEDEIGELARYKNARLSYFAGDFNWAQEQFDILKQATSRLISNDAIDMSVFILDNINQDTLGLALSQYSKAELKVFQNQYQEALQLLDSILVQYPKNSLEDDVFYLQAKIYNHLQLRDSAISRYNLILKDHKEEIRADNALYEMAQIYDFQLSEKTKAMELYEKLFTEFSGSTLAVEARQRFRKLRGDTVQ
ncbi:MAG: tetratricopeptide repeat protein [Saprospiraceae bacterium]|nr:tetratricopeptide repeat protein [Saprospiraceae bacterium]HMW39607.1 tetratricopeptide repeat protein [Saprospiraceae bacterium]HMX89324.1 tetratricopeptide repeat protein [Saprospiraceae bacterium]HMZ41220.1 tetratricopeptide repeat protein [Saprospiraceae bacterium]HNB30826.1 tetratricopeptide repeat protein [Saprospiraceae bacterium]